MSPTTTPASKQSDARTEFISGRNPKYEHLRITLDKGRAFIGLKGYSRALQQNTSISIELSSIALQELAVRAAQGLGILLAQQNHLRAAAPPQTPLQAFEAKIASDTSAALEAASLASAHDDFVEKTSTAAPAALPTDLHATASVAA
ncbi:MAG: hypothetical protein ACYDBQ_11225 [Thermoplasmatota archaeon]